MKISDLEKHDSLSLSPRYASLTCDRSESLQGALRQDLAVVITVIPFAMLKTTSMSVLHDEQRLSFVTFSISLTVSSRLSVEDIPAVGSSSKINAGSIAIVRPISSAPLMPMGQLAGQFVFRSRSSIRSRIRSVSSEMVLSWQSGKYGIAPAIPAKGPRFRTLSKTVMARKMLGTLEGSGQPEASDFVGRKGR